MNKYLKESFLWALIILPYVYLSTIWDKLPTRVPTHFNLQGNPDDWSGKSTLLFLPGAMCLGIYLLMLVIPFLDPKKKIQQMGSKYYNLRLMLAFFMSILSIYLLYISEAGSLKNPNMLLALIGILFAMLGNYFQTVRPNYFIGIRTPWTLESPETWRKTHILGGRIWIVGGALIAILSFFIHDNNAMVITFGVLISVMTLIPVIYSYVDFQKEKRN